VEVSGSELLFYGGIACIATAVVLAVAAAVVLHITGKRLKHKLEEEYGKKRH